MELVGIKPSGKFNYSRSNTILALLESMGYLSRLNIEAKETN